MKDPEDSFCILDLTLPFQQRFALTVVYGPNNDDLNFFLQLSGKNAAVGNEAVVEVGDWNVVLDYEWDTTDEAKQMKRNKSPGIDRYSMEFFLFF